MRLWPRTPKKPTPSKSQRNLLFRLTPTSPSPAPTSCKQPLRTPSPMPRSVVLGDALDGVFVFLLGTELAVLDGAPTTTERGMGEGVLKGCLQLVGAGLGLVGVSLKRRFLWLFEGVGFFGVLGQSLMAERQAQKNSEEEKGGFHKSEISGSVL